MAEEASGSPLVRALEEGLQHVDSAGADGSPGPTRARSGEQACRGVGARLGLTLRLVGLCAEALRSDGVAGQAAQFRFARLVIETRALECLSWAAVAGAPGDAELAEWGSREVLTQAVGSAAEIVGESGWSRYEALRARASEELRRDPGGTAAIAAWAAVANTPDGHRLLEPLPNGWRWRLDGFDEAGHTGAAGAAGQEGSSAPGGSGAAVAPRLTAEQVQALAASRTFLREELYRIEPQHGECGYLPDEVAARLEERARSLGLWAPYTPAELGGAGLGVLGAVLVREQLSKSVASDIRQARGVGGDPWPALFHARGQQRSDYLEPHIAGDKRMFFALTEPAAGSDAARIQTAATPSGQGWVLNGRKHFIGNGARADFGTVFAQAHDEAGQRLGVTCFIIEQGQPGLRPVREIETIGACRPAELVFEDCYVGPERVLGEVGGGFDLAKGSLSVKRVLQGSMSLGAAQRALEVVFGWVHERKTFGKLLAEREGVAELLLRACYGVRAARLMCYASAFAIDTEAPLEVFAETKVKCAQASCEAVDTAMQLCGAKGMSKDLPLERLYRDIRAFRVTEGADEVQYHLISRKYAQR